jgi:uroporphyrinogen decarboxylase
MMRQAGRFMPRFAAILKKTDFLTMCRTPEIAAEVTIEPVDALGVDAAILFSDITTTVVPMGMDLKYADSGGPYFSNPVRTDADVGRLVVPRDGEGLTFVYDTVGILARELAGRVPLIGFAGSPLAMASFMIEGAMSRNYSELRRMIFSNPATFGLLMDKIRRHTANYLRAQAKAGAQALMLFDSFAGVLGPRDFREFNLPHVRRLIGDLEGTGVPIIYFGLGAGGCLDQMRDCGADVVGIDAGLDLGVAIRALGNGVSVQGNLEPYVLFQDREQIGKRVGEVLEQGKTARGHIFNLGHGVPPGTPVDNAKALVDAVHDQSRS